MHEHCVTCSHFCLTIEKKSQLFQSAISILMLTHRAAGALLPLFAPEVYSGPAKTWETFKPRSTLDFTAGGAEERGGGGTDVHATDKQDAGVNQHAPRPPPPARGDTRWISIYSTRCFCEPNLKLDYRSERRHDEADRAGAVRHYGRGVILLLGFTCQSYLWRWGTEH